MNNDIKMTFEEWLLFYAKQNNKYTITTNTPKQEEQEELFQSFCIFPVM